ncbi:MAG TPA: hypothetical protein VJM33_00475 [Microthrixaceae bacterium]|nr:hypothetical protein [Microthrixaceae bacterium]
MGTSKTPAELSGKLAKMAQGLGRLPVEVEAQHARTAEQVVGAAVNAMSRDGRLSGVGRRGAPVGVKAVPTGRGSVLVVPKGPVWLVENDTAAHIIGAGRGREMAGRGRTEVTGTGRFYKLDAESTPLNFSGNPDDWITGPVPHPGTTGKGQWAAARDSKVIPATRGDTEKAMVDTMMAVFG